VSSYAGFNGQDYAAKLRLNLNDSTVEKLAYTLHIVAFPIMLSSESSSPPPPLRLGANCQKLGKHSMQTYSVTKLYIQTNTKIPYILTEK
jgi:hypothetical protein